MNLKKIVPKLKTNSTIEKLKNLIENSLKKPLTTKKKFNATNWTLKIISLSKKIVITKSHSLIKKINLSPCLWRRL
jgi:hypothetical protein